MSIFIDYSSNKPLQGILRSFYNKNLLWENIETYSPSFAGIRDYKNVFDFDSSGYWIAYSGDSRELYYVSFCFKYYYAKITGFEMETSNGAVLPKKFMFSSSLDNKTYNNNKSYEQEYTKNDKFYFPYRNDVAKCFKLTCLQSITNTVEFDVQQIEVYGEINKNLRHFLKITCKFKTFYSQSTIIFLFIVLKK